MRTKISYSFTNHYDERIPNNGFPEEKEKLITDGNYDFGDFLKDNNVNFIKDNDTYFVLDENGKKTGQAYMIWGILSLSA